MRSRASRHPEPKLARYRIYTKRTYEYEPQVFEVFGVNPDDAVFRWYDARRRLYGASEANLAIDKVERVKEVASAVH